MTIPTPTLEERVTTLEQLAVRLDAAVNDLIDKYADAVRRYQIIERMADREIKRVDRLDLTDSQAARLPREQRRARAGVDPRAKDPRDRDQILAVLRGTLPAIIGGTQTPEGGGTRDRR